MDLVLYLLGIVVVAIMFVVMLRYVLKHFGGTFNAWGAKHYAERSGTDQEQRDR